MSLIIKAAQFAERAHAGQFRKCGIEPYIMHPMRVAGMVSLLPDAFEEMAAAAWLHDVLEDTEATLSELNDLFGDRVATMVSSLTNVELPHGSGRAARKAAQLRRLESAGRHVQQIKLVDRIDNLNTMTPRTDKSGFRKLFVKESRDLLKAIGSADDKLAARLSELIGELENRRRNKLRDKKQME